MSLGARNQKWVVVAASLLFLGVAIFAPTEDENNPNLVRPSSFLTNRSDGKALYLSAEELGIECDRWMSPTSLLDRKVANFVSLHPSVRMTFSEADQILSWVNRGGHLLYVPAASSMGGDSGFEARETDPLLSRLKVRSEGVWDRMSIKPSPMKIDRSAWAPAEPLFADMGAAIGGLGHGLALRADKEKRNQWEILASRNSSDRGLARGDATEASQSKVMDESAATSGAVIGIARRSYGSGEIVLLSDATDLLNGRINDSEPALFVLRLLSSWRGRGVVYFDELHHGFKAGEGLLATVWGWLRRSRRGQACLGLFCLILIAVLINGLRLGSPIPAPPKFGRSSLDHVDALAQAYSRANGRNRSAQLLLEGFRLREARGALRSDSLALHLDDLAQAHPELAAEVECLRAEFEALERKPDPTNKPDDRSRPSLTRLAQAMDRVHAVAHAKAGHHKSLRVS